MRLRDAYRTGDAAAAAALYAPAGRHVEVATGAIRTGRPELERGLRTFFEAFPDATWTPDGALVPAGRAVAAPYMLRGTLRRRLGPWKPEGQRLELRGIHVLELNEDGGIAVLSDYWDAGEFGRQMENPKLVTRGDLVATTNR